MCFIHVIGLSLHDSRYLFWFCSSLPLWCLEFRCLVYKCSVKNVISEHMNQGYNTPIVAGKQKGQATDNKDKVKDHKSNSNPVSVWDPVVNVFTGICSLRDHNDPEARSPKTSVLPKFMS